MQTVTITQISEKIKLTTTIVNLLTCNVSRFPCANIRGKGRHFILSNDFFEDLKAEINKKILCGYNRNNLYKSAYLKVMEWQKEYINSVEN